MFKLILFNWILIKCFSYSQLIDQQNTLDRDNRYNIPQSSPSISHHQWNSQDIDPNSYCPEHWLAYRSSCMRFVRSPKKNWYEAKKICQAYGGDLVNIDSIEKHAFIVKYLILQNQHRNYYYISAKLTSVNNWINDDNTVFVNQPDSIVTDEQYEMDNPDELLPEIDRNFIDSYDEKIKNNRLVYGYSQKKQRWVFIPTLPTRKNLFICESTSLYSIHNIEFEAEDKRTYDYGIEIVDILKVPQGPHFIRQPIDTIFDTSRRKTRNDVTVSCLAGGYPNPVYKWFREDYISDILTFTEINPIENGHYTISGGNLIIENPIQNRDQGSYHCVAENKFGRIRSETITLNFGFITEFNQNRPGDNGDMNWGKAIACDEPQHYPAAQFYWSRDYFPNFVEEDQRVFVSNDGSLYFTSLEEVDRANYSCTVSTTSDTGRNGPFFPFRVKPHSNYQSLIFANSFPKIFPPAPVAGQEIRLECVAFGYPVPIYNWTRLDSPLPKHSYLTSYKRVLIIPNATINDAGIYSCSIHNDRVAATKNITLQIQKRPTFTIPLKDRVKDTTGNVTFICESFAIPDVNYTWYKNADRLDPDKINIDKYKIQDNILTILDLDADTDDGMYQCEAKNQLHAVYSSAQLRVLSMRPSFKRRPLESEVYAVYNGNTTIQCEPEAAPRPKITWKKDGQVIGAGGHRKILTNGTLIIAPTSRDDSGIYSCVPTNQYGADESQTRLIVLQELRFLQTLRNTIITNIGEVLFLRCEVVYDELLDVAFVWKHNGQRIDTDYEYRIIIDHNTLEIQNLTVLDSGEYECIARSSVNQISSRSNVIVQGPPGSPGGVKVIEVRKTSALIEWVDGAENGRRTELYNILGRTNWNRTWVEVANSISAIDHTPYSGRKQAEVHNLTPWSRYEFSVCAVNDLGISSPSAPSPQFQTQSDVPYMAPKNIAGGGGKIGDLTITWDELKREDQNAIGIHYKVFWRLHGKTDRFETKFINQSANRAVVSVNYQNYFTKYDVKVQAFNEIGAGPESEVAVVYSAEDMPQVAPQSPIAMSYNSTALNMTWNAVDQTRDIMRGKLIGHRLKYWQKDRDEEDAIYYLSRTTRNWALIVGLEPDTYYFVKVMVYNSAGEGPESERYLERTFRKAPQKPPSSVFIFGINPGTVRVVWRYVSPAYDEEPVAGFKIRVWEADQDMSTAKDHLVNLGQKLEAYISDLTPGKTYKLRVLAYSNGGDGRMSSPEHVFKMGVTEMRNSGTKLFINFSILLLMNLSYFIL